MRIYQIIVSMGAFFMIACHSKPTRSHTEKSPQAPQAAAAKANLSEEDKVVYMIMDLDEVKHKNAVVERLSKGKRRLSTYIETPPTNDDPEYWVKVAEDNGSNYVTYYTFTVNSKTHHIKYYDVAQDSLISIDEWRKATPAEDR